MKLVQTVLLPPCLLRTRPNILMGLLSKLSFQETNAVNRGLGVQGRTNSLVIVERIVENHHIIHTNFLILLLISLIHKTFLGPHVLLVFEDLLVDIESIHRFIHRVLVHAHAFYAFIVAIHLFWTRFAQVTASFVVERF